MNIGGGHTVSLMDAIRVIEDAAGRRARVNYGEPCPGDSRATSASTELLMSATGWSPSTPLEEGIRAQFDWISGGRY
jgi:UDP-glucuronate 4-epimerase